MVNQGARAALALTILSASMACSGPRPILYPNTHFQTAGEETAEQDIDDCRSVAKKAGATPGGGKGTSTATSTVVGAATGAAGGAAGGAVVGAASSGSAIGAVSGAVFGLIGGLFRPSPPSQAYVNSVNRCLNERGYEVSGWQ